MTLNELITTLQWLQSKGYGNLRVITDMEEEVLDAEHNNDDGDDAAIVLALA